MPIPASGHRHILTKSTPSVYSDYMGQTSYAEVVDLRVRDFPLQLNKYLKALAALDGMSLTKKVIELLWEGVRRDTRIKDTASNDE